jgi:hypothetical protein
MSKARDLADSAQEINILDGKSFLDEDNLASDSATGIASQQSIKAYVDGITTTNITSTGALNSGSITSGFGNIDNGSSTITTTGAITGGSFVIGSADINENDLESIDGITAGTVSASKAVVVNTNKDITGFRNITATGTISGSLSGTLSGAIASTTTATTQAESDDSTKVATTAYVTDKITTLIGGAPSTLNDLNELAAAINDDANYNSTLTTALATKLPLAGGTMTGDVLYNDNVKAKFGAGSDLQIYHDGSHSYIVDAGTGNMYISTNGNGIVMQASLNETMFAALPNGAVTLYHDNSAKLATTSTGIDVTGTVTSDGLTVQNNNNLDIHDADNHVSGRLRNVSGGNNALTIEADPNNSASGSFISLKIDTSEKMRIDSSGNLLVGTTTADGGYDESDGGASTVFMGASIGGAASGTAFVSRRAAPLQLNRQANDGDIAVFRKNGATVGSIFSGHGGTQVGIGTNTTGITFNPATRSMMPANPSSTSPQLDATLDIGFPSVRWKDLYLSGGLRSDTLKFSNLSGTERMRIDSGGSVAIGLSSAGTKLDVGGTIRSVVSGGTPILYLNNGTTQHSIQNTSGAFTFFNNGTERMRIDSSGKVGIGDSSPTARLDIGGMAAGEVGLQITSARNDAISTGLAYINVTDSVAPFSALTIDHNGTGKLIEFRDGGTLSGVIFKKADQLCIGVHDTNIRFLDSSDSIIPVHSGGDGRNDSISLGTNGARFKNGYFSGNLYGDGSNLTGVGGSTAYGAVGTYIFAYHLQNNGTISGGGTKSGSTLRPAGLGWNTGGDGNERSVNGGVWHGVESAPSGTWRFMSSMTTNISGRYPGGIWVRIS